MLKRLLITVVLSMLILNLSVRGSIIIYSHTTLSSSKDFAGREFPSEHQELPPLEEDARDTQMPESEDEFACPHFGNLIPEVASLSIDSICQSEPNELEGACTCLIKPPAAAFVLS